MLKNIQSIAVWPGTSLAVMQQFGRNRVIVLQKSFCTGDQKFCGLQARLSCKDVRDLIASR